MTTKHELRIEGMSCNHCVSTVEKALRAIPGVKSVLVVLGRAEVETDEALSTRALVEAVEQVDYPVTSAT